MRGLLGDRIELLEVLFADRKDEIKSSLAQCYKMTLEFMKCMEMYENDEDDVPHWIDGLCLCIDACDPKYYFILFSKVAVYLGKIPKDVSDLLKKENSKDMFDDIREDILAKYKKYIPSKDKFKYKDEDYKMMLTVLYKVLIGEIDVDSIDGNILWDRSVYSLNEFIISDLDPTRRLSKIKIKKLVSKLIYHLNWDQSEVLVRRGYLK